MQREARLVNVVAEKDAEIQRLSSLLTDTNGAVQKTVKDAVVVVSKVAGYGAALKDVWISEYRRYEAQQNAGPGASPAHEYLQAGARGGR